MQFSSPRILTYRFLGNSGLSLQAALMELAPRSPLERARPGCDTVLCGFRMTALPVRLFIIKQRLQDTGILAH